MQLKSYRKNQGLTQAELAERLGCRQSDISDFERGERVPTLPQALKIAALTGGNVKPEDFSEAANALEAIKSNNPSLSAPLSKAS